jgi:hypothetical protein
MFETLNDRGLRIAQADLLKNYLFGTARDRLENIQPKWASMTGALETIGDDDLTVTYIRHFWITKHGPTRERELSHRIKNVVNSRHRTVEFVAELSDSSSDYVATMSPDHPKWNEYGNDTKKHIRTIARHLRVEQIRPLMFAAAKYFTGCLSVGPSDSWSQGAVGGYWIQITDHTPN